MPRTQRLIVASLTLVLGLGLGFLLSGIFQSDRYDATYMDMSTPLPPEAQEFKSAITAVVTVEKPELAGYTPEVLLEVFAGMKVEDFSEVRAVVGRYDVKDGALTYSNTEVVDGAAADISDEGYRRLRENIYKRLNISATTSAAVVVESLKKSSQATSEPPILPPTTDVGTICTQDVKECSDGSYVSRQGPGCQFAECPNPQGNSSVACKPEQRLVDMCTEQYEPVCAAYQVQCITTPCNPVPKTYSNSCFACMDNNVLSYTKGECRAN